MRKEGGGAGVMLCDYCRIVFGDLLWFWWCWQTSKLSARRRKMTCFPPVVQDTFILQRKLHSCLNHPHIPSYILARSCWFPVILALCGKWERLFIVYRCASQSSDADHMFVSNPNLHLSAFWNMPLSKPWEVQCTMWNWISGFRWLLQPMHMHYINMKKPDSSKGNCDLSTHSN